MLTADAYTVLTEITVFCVVKSPSQSVVFRLMCQLEKVSELQSKQSDIELSALLGSTLIHIQMKWISDNVI